jgi:hypothetical protein
MLQTCLDRCICTISEARLGKRFLFRFFRRGLCLHRHVAASRFIFVLSWRKVFLSTLLGSSFDSGYGKAASRKITLCIITFLKAGCRFLGRMKKKARLCKGLGFLKNQKIFTCFGNLTSFKIGLGFIRILLGFTLGFLCFPIIFCHLLVLTPTFT